LLILLGGRSPTHQLTATRQGSGIPGADSEMRLAEDGGHANAARVMASPIAWRRSSRCATQSCVEIADLPDGGVAVRDSKSPDSTPILVFAADEWNAFISGAKAGEFG
jgi:hypothetical protein